jgi:protein tyrosine phosphatase
MPENIPGDVGYEYCYQRDVREVDPRRDGVAPSPHPAQLDTHHRTDTLPSTLEDGPVMISSTELKGLLENTSESQLLVLDLRIAPQFSKCRIKGALNLCIPTTLLKRPSFNLRKLTDTFKVEEEKAHFSTWRVCKYIVIYDARSTEKRDATSAINILKKFTNEGWEGRPCILRGGIEEFSQKYPHLTDDQLGHEMMTSKKPLSLDLVTANVAPVVRGSEIPRLKSTANPFFSNIRQNMDLVGDVDQIDVKRPEDIDPQADCFLPKWLRKAAAVEDHGKTVAAKFLRIEQDELSRMQKALSSRVSYETPVADTERTIQIAGVEKGGKNRYNNIWPFEHARVRLQGRPEGACDYVNASHIKASWSNKRYIASQGPLPATFEVSLWHSFIIGFFLRKCKDFWSVVWDQDVRVIVMLTAESEGGQLKCHPYWAAKEYGAFKLKALSEKKVSLDLQKHRRSMTRKDSSRRRARNSTESSPAPSPANELYVIVRKFTLSHSSEPFMRMREVTQLHYSSWPDFGAPAHPIHLLALIEMANSLQRAASSPAARPHTKADDPEDSPHARPLLVHCSAGCGRTGTFCTVDSVVDMLKRQRKEHKSGVTAMEITSDGVYMSKANNPANESDDWIFDEEVDLVQKTVEDFRKQRISMVQTLRQYVLCYETALEWIGQQRTGGRRERTGSETRVSGTHQRDEPDPRALATPSLEINALSPEPSQDMLQELDESDYASMDSSSFEEPQSSFGKNRNKVLQKDAISAFSIELTAKDFSISTQIGHPRLYFTKLHDLKTEVYENSALALLQRQSKTLNDGRAFPILSSTALHREATMTELGKMTISKDREAQLDRSTQLLFHSEAEQMVFGLVECRNVLFIVLENLARLQRAKVVESYITILAANEDRPNVAKFVKIHVKDVGELANSFTDQISLLCREVNNIAGTLSGLIQNTIKLLTESCELFSEALDCRPFESPLTALYSTVCFLDLAVLAYAGAHTEAFDNTGNAEQHFDIPESMTAKLRGRSVLRRYSTSCLQQFLRDQQVWVFHKKSFSVDSPVYVSAEIEEFADIWGPVWRVQDERNSAVTQHYDLGNGLIVPWEYDATLHAKLDQDEQLCHWIAKKSPWKVLQKESRVSDERVTSTSPSLAINPNTRLLIGARQHRNHMVWSACRCDIKNIEEELRGLNRLQQLGTNRSYAYVDSRAFSLACGSSGVTVGGSITTKRAKGVYFGEAFLNLWEKQPGLRNPRYLANLWGVAISLCTMNAERISVFELLDVPSMRRFLEQYPWSASGGKDEFLQTLRTGGLEGLEALCNLWTDNGEELGKVLLACFQILSCTGLDVDRQEFGALWIPPDTLLPKRVLLKPSEHSWIKFLRDTEVSFTVAVMVEECLGAKFGHHRRRCGKIEGPSALQTSICVNDGIEPSSQLIRRQITPHERESQKWAWQWDVSRLETGAGFPVGAQGRLKTIEVLTKSRILLEWDLIWSKAILEKIGIQTRPPPSHWEYTEPDDCDVRPIPVYLWSSCKLIRL